MFFFCWRSRWIPSRKKSLGVALNGGFFSFTSSGRFCFPAVKFWYLCVFTSKFLWERKKNSPPKNKRCQTNVLVHVCWCSIVAKLYEILPFSLFWKIQIVLVHYIKVRAKFLDFPATKKRPKKKEGKTKFNRNIFVNAVMSRMHVCWCSIVAKLYEFLLF